MDQYLWVLIFGLLASIAVVVLARQKYFRSKENSLILKEDNLIFFRTSGYWVEQENVWRIPIHGWVYSPEDSKVRKSVFARFIKRKYGISLLSDAVDNFSQRVNLFVADNKRAKQVEIELLGKRYHLPKSKANGHIVFEIDIQPSNLEEIDQLFVSYSAVLSPDDTRIFKGDCQLIPPLGKSVISDIDDTVKLSGVTNKEELLSNTFYNDFKSVEGMSGLYGRWGKQGMVFHYVSSSPWHLYNPLLDFFVQEAFPWATLSLKVFRFKDRTFFDLFKKGTKTKPEQIEQLLTRYPNRNFILVGDSGEQDAEVYAKIAKKFPTRIEKILIRNVPEAMADVERYQKLFLDVDDRLWQVFDAPEDVDIN